MYEISKLIYNKRKEEGMTMNEAARKAKISYRTYERFEKGSIKTVHVLENVLDAFGFKIEIKKK